MCARDREDALRHRSDLGQDVLGGGVERLEGLAVDVAEQVPALRERLEELVAVDAAIATSINRAA